MAGAVKCRAWLPSDFSQDTYVQLSILDLFSRVQSFFVSFPSSPYDCSVQTMSDMSTQHGGYEKQALNPSAVVTRRPEETTGGFCVQNSNLENLLFLIMEETQQMW